MNPTQPIPNSPYPSPQQVVQTPPLANLVGHQESSGAGGAFYPGPKMPSGPQNFYGLRGGQPINVPGGFGIAASSDIDTRRIGLLNDQNQKQDADINNQFGNPNFMGALRKRLKDITK